MDISTTEQIEAQVRHFQKRFELLEASNLRIRVRQPYGDLEIYSLLTGEKFGLKISKKELRFLLNRFPGLKTEE